MNNSEGDNSSDSPQESRLKADSSLKMRLKHLSRVRPNLHSPSTPTSVYKKVEINDVSTTPKLTSLQLTSDLDEDNILYSKEIIENCDNKEQLWKIYSHLKKTDAKDSEKLRKLHLVRQHQSKNSPNDLILLIQKWLETGQKALLRLYELLPDPKPENMQCLIDHLQINAGLVKYNQDSDTFS